MKMCQHCGLRKAVRPRDLCQVCHGNLDVRRKYKCKIVRDGEDEPTDEELERTIERQRQRLPSWWGKEEELIRQRRDKR